MLPDPSNALAGRVPRKWPSWVGALHWDRLAPWRAARVSIGVVLPLIAGWAAHHADWGAYVALGALPAGVASFQGEARSRVVAVVAATIGMALSTFVGAVAPKITPWSLVPILAAWGYLTGLSVCLGQRWSVAVLQWSIALLIAVGFPMSPGEAALRAGLVLSGGLVQALAVAASWALDAGRRERESLAMSYKALATYASQLAEGDFGPPPSEAFPARTALEDPNPLLARPLWWTLVNLLEQAERIRASLAALGAVASHAASDAAEVRDFLKQMASALGVVADALTAKRSQRSALLHELDAQISGVSIAQSAPWHALGEALLGQLRAVCSVGDLNTAARRGSGPGTITVPGTPSLKSDIVGAFAMLRANMTIRSEAGRHAVRLAAVAALSEIIVQTFHIYQGRWAALTIFFVLKPDYASTLDRGTQRALGTALGAILGGIAAVLAGQQQLALVAAAGVSIAIAYLFFDVNYLVFSVMLTTFVVILLVLLGLPATATAEARFYDTLLGAAMALIAYVLWPTWRRATAHETFAQLVEAHREYSTALLRALVHGGSVGERTLRALQGAARRARSDAEAAAARLAEEPSEAPFTAEIAQLLTAVVARLALAELGLHALAMSRDENSGKGDAIAQAATPADAFTSALAIVMTRVATALRNLQAPQAIPSLRAVYDPLPSIAALRGSAFVTLLDRLVDGTNTLYAIVEQHLSSRGAASAPEICSAQR